MIYHLVGHRGAGKTSLLKRIQSYFDTAKRKVVLGDLDALIEELAGKSIQKLFQEQGEARFREIELEAYKKFMQRMSSAQDPVYLSLGAGFPMNQIDTSDGSRVIWVRRPTDIVGRIFLDRPRLDPNRSPIEEYLERFEKRESEYKAHAHYVWSVLEGWDFPNSFEEHFFLHGIQNSNSFQIPFLITLDPLSKVVLWSGAIYELRTDLMSPDLLKAALARIPRDRILWSFRAPNVNKSQIDEVLSLGLDWDWPCELGDLRSVHPEALPTWISLHERKVLDDREESVAECIHRLAAQEDLVWGVAVSSQPKLKLAIEIRSFTELMQGHRWFLEDPAHRSFLPRTPQRGRLIDPQVSKWGWYRLWTLPLSPLSFVRDAHGSSVDQPNLAQVLQRMHFSKASVWFAAVLGSPITQSRTPAEHFDFFARRGMPVMSIPVERAEWVEAIQVLREMGLRAAAVTAPLKLEAGKLTNSQSGHTAVNTLFWSDSQGEWLTTNTDYMGLNKLLEGFSCEQKVAVWGGGGTLEVIRGLLPHAHFYSARSGEIRELKREVPSFSPQILIWAAGLEHLKFPPEPWKPHAVIDLSYSEASPAREYAMRVGAQYFSGLPMFLEQARGQREFWKEKIREDGHGRKFIW